MISVFVAVGVAVGAVVGGIVAWRRGWRPDAPQVGLILLMAAVMVVMGAGIAQAAAPGRRMTQDLPPVDFGEIEEYVASLGVGALIMVAIEILKRVGAIPDGQAGTWATVANVVAFAALVVAGVFGVDLQGGQMQGVLDLLVRIGQGGLTIISSPLLFEVLRQAQVLGRTE